MRGLIVSVFLLLGCIRLSGQESRKEFCIGFPVGRSVPDMAYGDNAARLSEAVSFLEQVKKDSTLQLVGVSFSGFASPEGGFAINRELAQKRRNSLEWYIRERVSLPDSIITRCEETIAWEHLAELVKVSDMPHKEEAVDVLLNIPEFTYNHKGVLTDSRKKHLMELQYGRTWRYMSEHFFDKIRNAGVMLVTVRQKPAAEEAPVATLPAPTDTTAAAEHTDTVAPTPSVAPERHKPFRMVVKTNLLYDALAVPNIGVEFYLGRNWSVGGNWMYGWWKKNSRHRYWRIYGGDIVLRKWFGSKAEEKPLAGHHAGVYGQLFTYDFEWGGKGYMGGEPGGTLWNKMNYAAGVEYGYSLSVARRLNLDFTIGAGYWGGKYYEYIPQDGHYVWQATKNRHWVGPTKAEISLVWLIGSGCGNNRKGGLK